MIFSKIALVPLPFSRIIKSWCRKSSMEMLSLPAYGWPIPQMTHRESSMTGSVRISWRTIIPSTSAMSNSLCIIRCSIIFVLSTNTVTSMSGHCCRRVSARVPIMVLPMVRVAPMRRGRRELACFMDCSKCSWLATISLALSKSSSPAGVIRSSFGNRSNSLVWYSVSKSEIIWLTVGWEM